MPHPFDEPTVYLVDDDQAVRDSLGLLITTYGLQVVSCASAEEFLARWQPEVVGCLVLDVHMPGLSGLELQELLRQRRIGTPVVFITGQAEVDACRRAFQGGAVDFLTKPVAEDALLAGIRRGIGEDLRRHRSHHEISTLREKLAQLSEREREVLTLMLEGLPNKLIARAIGLSTRTVESHRSRIYAKLEAGSLAELVRCVVKVEEGDGLPWRPLAAAPASPTLQ